MTESLKQHRQHSSLLGFVYTLNVFFPTQREAQEREEAEQVRLEQMRKEQEEEKEVGTHYRNLALFLHALEHLLSPVH